MVLQFVTLIDIVLGQKGTVNPSAMLASLLSRRAKLHEELHSIEKQVTFSILASKPPETVFDYTGSLFFFWEFII
jgi:hypothetical protein